MGRVQYVEHSNVSTYKILQVIMKNRPPQKKIENDSEMNGVKLEGVLCIQDLDVTIAWNLKFSHQSKDAADKANMYNAGLHKQEVLFQK